MNPEKLIEIFKIAQDISLGSLYLQLESIQDLTARWEMTCYIEEIKDMFDYKFECLKMRAALV